jgi:hypothetical protein
MDSREPAGSSAEHPKPAVIDEKPSALGDNRAEETGGRQLEGRQGCITSPRIGLNHTNGHLCRCDQRLDLRPRLVGSRPKVIR